MTLSGFFIMMWKDERLAWQHDDFETLHVSIFELTFYKIDFYFHIHLHFTITISIEQLRFLL